MYKPPFTQRSRSQRSNPRVSTINEWLIDLIFFLNISASNRPKQAKAPSQTSTYCQILLTDLTFHLTAPHKSTLTIVHHLSKFVLVATATAQNTATLFTLWSCVTFASLCSKGAQCGICSTEWGWIFRVDKIHFAGGFNGFSLGDETVSVVAGDYFGSAVEALFETVANLTEWRHPAPAGFQGAWAG